MNAFDWMLFGCVVVLALAGSYVTGQNRVLVGVVEMWKRRCEDRAAKIASLEQTVVWLKSELGQTEGAAREWGDSLPRNNTTRGEEDGN